jgi:molybdopterin synthase catalytic subunit
MIHAAIVHEPIAHDDVLSRVGAEVDGAVLLFLGVVRNHADDRPVDSDRLCVIHRVGDLAVGETSVAIAVSSPHRAEAYDASRYVIEEIKKRLPVWKKEHYADGKQEWVEGTVPPVAETASLTPEDAQ